jgi:hypothetical protein
MSYSILNKNILKLENVLYYEKQFYILGDNDNIYKKYINNYKCISDKNVFNSLIQENVKKIPTMFCIETLHSCFCHALIDYLFPYYWAQCEIKEDNKTSDIQYFIIEKEIKQYDDQKQDLDYKNKNWKDTSIKRRLLNTISNGNDIFEFFLSNNDSFYIDTCYFYNLGVLLVNTCYRSPWNHIEHHIKRKTLKKNAMFKDDEINYWLLKFSIFIKKHFNIEEKKTNGKNVVIIDRDKISRILPRNMKPLLNPLKEIIINNNYQFNGVVYLEHLSLKDQIKIFVNNDIIIAPHGAGLIHSIWTSNKKIIEISFDKNYDIYYKRICKVGNNNHLQIQLSKCIDAIKKELNYKE